MTAELRVKVMLERRGSSSAAIAFASSTSAREGRGSGGGAGLVAVFFGAGFFDVVFFAAAFAVAFFAADRLVGCGDGVAALVVFFGAGASPESEKTAAASVETADVLAAERFAAVDVGGRPDFLAAGRFAATGARAARDPSSAVGSPVPRPADAAAFRARDGAAAFDAAAGGVDVAADPLWARRCVVFAGVARPVSAATARTSGRDAAASTGGAAATLSSGMQTFLIVD